MLQILQYAVPFKSVQRRLYFLFLDKNSVPKKINIPNPMHFEINL